MAALRVNHLVTCWRITFANGFIVECFRERKPTRLADSWAKSKLVDGSTYGAYTIASQGVFNKHILELRSATCLRSVEG